MTDQKLLFYLQIVFVMWHSSTYIILVAIISMGIIRGIFATMMSFCPEKFEEDLSLNFEEPMDKCDNALYDIVKLDNISLRELKDNFIQSINVQSIILENNDIINISPNAFKAVPNLLCLNIRWNYQSNILNNFLNSFKHSSLEKLNLAGTLSEDIREIPKISSEDNTERFSECDLPRVTHLDISVNNLEDLPYYLESSFPRLTHLYLSDNRLTSTCFNRIPASTQYLYLERNAVPINLRKLPKNISGLFLKENHLELHDISSTYLRFDYNFKYNLQNTRNKNDYLVRNFESLSNLVILSVRSCKNIEFLIYNLDKCKNLVDLDMSSNRIGSLDEEKFKTLKFLQRFSLDNNSLSSLSFLIHLRSLTNLSIAYNNLTNITSDSFINLGNLKTLNLRGNRISTIEDDAFLSLKMLEKLDLSGNNLAILPPEWFINMKELHYLNLKSNLFTSLDDMYVYGLSNLHHLFLESNCLSQLEIGSFEKISSTVVVYMSPMNNTCGNCIT